MPYAIDDLPEKLSAWLMDSDEYINDVVRGTPEPEPEQYPIPYAPEQDIPEPAVAARRTPLPVPDERPAAMPKPSPQVAPADPSYRPPATGKDGESPFDIRRALSSLFGGQQAVSDYDRNKLAETAAKMHEKQAAEDRGFKHQEFDLKRRKDQREQELHEALTPGKAAKLEAETRKIGLGSDAMDPSSERSKAAVQMMADRIEAKAGALPEGQVKSYMAQFVQNVRSKGSPITALDAAQWADRFGVDVHDIMRDLQQTRAQGSKDEQNDEKNKQAWARIALAGDRAQEHAGDRVRAQQAKDQAKLDDEVEKANWVRDRLLEVAEIKKNVNTGPIAGRAQEALQTFDLSSQDFDKLKTKIAMISNRIIKELSGSAVTGNEWTRMQDELANINNDDSNFVTKLAEMLSRSESIKQMAINRYTRDESGAPTQQTNTARRTTAQVPRTVQGEQPPLDATPKSKSALAAPKPWPGAQPGQKKRDKNTGIIWVMQSDGTLKQEK